VSCLPEIVVQAIWCSQFERATSLLAVTVPAMVIAAMRVARPTAQLDRVREFYETVVGLPVLWAFEDHDGFDGVIFGVPDERAQLELVTTPHATRPEPTAEDALVLYLAADELDALVERLRTHATAEVAADDAELNPYWPNNGAVTFVDPDGYRLIISPA
jgi:catechol 2,3-dioxygenase-like lactoylglutathione lyase family enzyme